MNKVNKRGIIGRLERLPSLDCESRDDFFNGVRGWHSRVVSPKAKKRFEKILRLKGLDPKKDLELDQILTLIKDDFLINLEALCFLEPKRRAHNNYRIEFEKKSDLYLSELEHYDNLGPGRIEVNPDLKIPHYTKHEIHQQPGGYVGHPFSGHLYHYGTNAFYLARNIDNHQDQTHTKMGRQMPSPSDQNVRRILDMGCGVGQLSIALKERFSKADVWGIDVAAPMLRYAHMRSVDLNIKVNFSQQLAEKTTFPDNHFDIVTSYILHHEVPEDISIKIVNEAFRILRPGGIFFPIDFLTGGVSKPNAWFTLKKWIDHRWNNEVWRPSYEKVNLNGAMRSIGFDVNEKGPAAWYRKYNVLATKPA